MPGNWPVPFGKELSEKGPSHGHLVGGPLHSGDDVAGGRVPGGEREDRISSSAPVRRACAVTFGSAPAARGVLSA
jgi:hypothetical protein